MPQGDRESRLEIALRHQRLLSEHVPSRARAIEARLEPLFLIDAEEREFRIESLRGLLDVRGSAASGRRARLVAAILPVVEEVELHEPPERDAMVEPHVRAERNHLPPQRQVLEVGAIRRRTPREQPLAAVQRFAAIVRVSFATS